MKRFMAVIALASVSLVCFGAAPAGRLHFKAAGFSIQPLEAQPSDTLYQTLMMLLPPSDGFSPNVNVQIQPYTGTIEEYTDLSRKQFVAARLKLIKETKQGKSSVLLEYTGIFQGHELHWYAKAISTGKIVYLVTATAMEAQWHTVGTKLKVCVNSFAIDKGEQDAQRDAEDRAP